MLLAMFRRDLKVNTYENISAFSGKVEAVLKEKSRKLEDDRIVQAVALAQIQAAEAAQAALPVLVPPAPAEVQANRSLLSRVLGAARDD